MLTGDTWGISGTSFLVGYSIAVVLVAIGLWIQRQGLLNGRGSTVVGGLHVYDLATLNGGPQLAITVAAARLHAVGALAPSATRCTVVTADRPDAAGPPGEIEQEIVDAAQPGISSSELRAQVAQSAPIKRMVSRLEHAGLLLDEQTQSRLRRQWLWALPVLALGIGRMVTGIQNDRPIGYLLMILIAATIGTVWLAVQRVYATTAGKRLIDAERDSRTTLRQASNQSEIPIAVALFGGGALWVADPAFASALGVPREDASRSTGGGGGCDTGCGGCGCGGGCG